MTSVDLPSLRGVGRARRQPKRTGFMRDVGCLRDLPQAALSPPQALHSPTRVPGSGLPWDTQGHASLMPPALPGG